jgi:hypothetical protein
LSDGNFDSNYCMENAATLRVSLKVPLGENYLFWGIIL